MVPAITIAVIGIGNAYRTDDGVGLYVARKFTNHAVAGVKAVVGIGDGFALMDEWSSTDLAFVIDCAWSGAAPGTIFRFDALCETIPSNLFRGVSTHSISINEAIEIARILNRLPRRLIVYGIEGQDCFAGATVTPEVLQGADDMIRQINREIGTFANRQEGGFNHA